MRAQIRPRDREAGRYGEQEGDETSLGGVLDDDGSEIDRVWVWKGTGELWVTKNDMIPRLPTHSLTPHVPLSGCSDSAINRMASRAYAAATAAVQRCSARPRPGEDQPRATAMPTPRARTVQATAPGAVKCCGDGGRRVGEGERKRRERGACVASNETATHGRHALANPLSPRPVVATATTERRPRGGGLWPARPAMRATRAV